MGRPFLLLIFIFLHTGSSAQILNIEKFRIDKDTFNVWAGNIGIGFSSKKQQNTITTLNANDNVAFLSKNHTYLNIGNIKFIGTDGGKLISEGYTHFRAILDRRSFISYEPFIQWQYDLGRGLDKRELYGFTFRFNFIRSKKILLAANTGGMFEHEIWKGTVLRFPVQGEPGLAETEFFKSTTTLSIRGDLANNVYILIVGYYQARPEKYFNPRVISETHLNLIINKYFTLNNQFSFTYDDLPILTENRFVYSFNTNLMIKF